MKALSIKQPYAQLIAEGIKDIENRTFRTTFRGTIYIHASGKWHDRLKYNLLFNKWQWLDLVNKNSKTKFNLYRYLEVNVETDRLPVSAIIGQVDIIDCVQDHKSIWAEHSKAGEKPIWNWVLANAILYERPILNVKGKLSFWEFRDLIECRCCTDNETEAEMHICKMCEQEYCVSCQAPFNQYSQIDFNCCMTCYNRHEDEH